MEDGWQSMARMRARVAFYDTLGQSEFRSASSRKISASVISNFRPNISEGIRFSYIYIIHIYIYRLRALGCVYYAMVGTFHSYLVKIYLVDTFDRQLLRWPIHFKNVLYYSIRYIYYNQNVVLCLNCKMKILTYNFYFSDSWELAYFRNNNCSLGTSRQVKKYLRKSFTVYVTNVVNNRFFGPRESTIDISYLDITSDIVLLIHILDYLKTIKL